jgi:MoaA/NifB/PqqE/SkfB family radical SAM enzyme
LTKEFYNHLLPFVFRSESLKTANILSPLRRYQSDRSAEPVQVTLDPHAPGVTRVHLIPLKPGLLKRSPSQVLINGWHMFLIGPSWADLMRTFMVMLTVYSKPGETINDEKLKMILDKVVEHMHQYYPGVAPSTFKEDLDKIVSFFIAVAHGGPLPENFQTNVTFEQLKSHMRAPHRMDLLVSPMLADGQWQCPLHCRGCYAAQQEGMKIKKELTTAQWKTIIDRCRQAGIPQLTFTGGEPTQRADLVELIHHAEWHVTRLNTSGVNLSLELCRALEKANLDGVQVTLYSDDHHIHDQLVGKLGAWMQTVQGIQNALKAGLSVSVNTPLLKLNANYAPTLKAIRSLGVKYATCSGLIPAGNAPARIKGGEALTSEELLEVLRIAVNTSQPLGLDLGFTSPGWLSSEQLAEIGLSSPVCGACLSNMAVMPNGAVTACQSWLDNPDGLGNLLTTPWEEIWNHPQCRQMRRSEPEGCPLQENLK